MLRSGGGKIGKYIVKAWNKKYIFVWIKKLLVSEILSIGVRNH